MRNKTENTQISQKQIRVVRFSEPLTAKMKSGTKMIRSFLAAGSLIGILITAAMFISSNTTGSVSAILYQNAENVQSVSVGNSPHANAKWSGVARAAIAYGIKNDVIILTRP
ncbi:MAG: hypothetical protein ABI402_19565 [Ferruginibacter sp.]